MRRICLDARLVTGLSGGVEQIIIGLAFGLSKLTDGHEEYLFLTLADADAWLQPYIHGPCRILLGPVIPKSARLKGRVSAAVPVLQDAWHRLRLLANPNSSAPDKSDGTIERAGVSVMHFTTQKGFLTDVPSIYHPHDLQHLHMPEFFKPWQLQFRETRYRRFCGQARMVAVTSYWVKRDVMQRYGLPDDKVRVIPFAPPVAAYSIPTNADLAAVRKKFSLPEAFVFYPAQTWAHKNHIGLLQALAIIREKHRLKIPLVSTGRQNAFYREITKQARNLGLAGQVQFLGFISPLELQCLYKLCRGVIVPTKFEAASFPLWEAFVSGAPAACSNVTSLPEQAGGAALIFDPEKPEEIAEATLRIWTDEALRRTLLERGHTNVARFSWERTARIFRAHYRRLAGGPLTEEDRALIDSPPML
jgi:glycosyltransferase involved in cell wall biosynthesis